MNYIKSNTSSQGTWPDHKEELIKFNGLKFNGLKFMALNVKFCEGAFKSKNENMKILKFNADYTMQNTLWH